MIKVCWFDKEGEIKDMIIDTRISMNIHAKLTQFYEKSQDGDMLIMREEGQKEVIWKNNGGYVFIDI